MKQQCCGEGLLAVRAAAAAVAEDTDALELYRQWQELSQEQKTTTGQWLAWEQAMERSPVLARYFSLLRKDQDVGVCEGACSEGCSACGR